MPIPIRAPARPHTEPLGGDGVSIPQRSPTHSRLLAPSRRRLCPGRRMACRCATCEAWLRCPWAVAGSRSHNAAPLTLDSWLPRGVGFVPGAAWPADARPVRPGCGARGRWRGIHPTTQLHLLSARAPSRRRLCSGRRMACRCAACEAWLRCPWAVAGSRSHNAAPLTLDSWLPRGVGFVPGAAWPARPLAARAASCARRVVSKPGQALQALRRPPQGRHLLSTVLRPSPVCLAQRPYT